MIPKFFHVKEAILTKIFHLLKLVTSACLLSPPKKKNKMSTHLFFRENTLCLFGIRARAYSFCSEKERRLGQPACQEGKAVPQFLTSRFRSDTKVTQM
jgi:hypothetical protein